MLLNLIYWYSLVKDIDRKNEQTAAILKRQADQLAGLEALYKEEHILRKRYFNMMEGYLSYIHDPSNSFLCEYAM